MARKPFPRRLTADCVIGGVGFACLLYLGLSHPVGELDKHEQQHGTAEHCEHGPKNRLSLIGKAPAKKYANGDSKADFPNVIQRETDEFSHDRPFPIVFVSDRDKATNGSDDRGDKRPPEVHVASSPALTAESIRNHPSVEALS